MPRTLADVVLDEGLKKRLSHALAVAMDTPPRYGGPPPSKKPKKKPEEPLGKRLKRFATDAAHAMFPRVEGVEESLADKVREYADVSDSSHPWNKIAKTLEKWGDKSGEDSAPKTSVSMPKRSELLKPKRKEPEKAPSAAAALKNVVQARRQARADRDREKQDRARSTQIGRSQPGTKAHVEKLRKQHAQRA